MISFFRHNVSQGTRNAFTLVEMLAVIVIVSIVTTAIIIGLASADRGAHMLKALAAVREMDARARLHGRTSGQSGILTTDVDRLVLTADNGQEIMSRWLQGDVTISLIPVSNIDCIIFDRQGRSDDYDVRLEATSLIRQFHVTGMNGFLREVQP